MSSDYDDDDLFQLKEATLKPNQYRIDDRARIWRFRAGDGTYRMLKIPGPCAKYRYALQTATGKRQWFDPERLLFCAFYHKNPNEMAAYQIKHRDQDPANHAIENLQLWHARMPRDFKRKHRKFLNPRVTDVFWINGVFQAYAPTRAVAYELRRTVGSVSLPLYHR